MLVADWLAFARVMMLVRCGMFVCLAVIRIAGGCFLAMGGVGMRMVPAAAEQSMREHDQSRQ